MDLDLTRIEKLARAAEVRGEGVSRRTLKGLDVEELEDDLAERGAAGGLTEQPLGAED